MPTTGRCAWGWLDLQKTNGDGTAFDPFRDEWEMEAYWD